MQPLPVGTKVRFTPECSNRYWIGLEGKVIRYEAIDGQPGVSDHRVEFQALFTGNSIATWFDRKEIEEIKPQPMTLEQALAHLEAQPDLTAFFAAEGILKLAATCVTARECPVALYLSKATGTTQYVGCNAVGESDVHSSRDITLSARIQHWIAEWDARLPL